MAELPTYINDFEKRLVENEYGALRKEITDRLARISRLQQALLLGALIYLAPILGQVFANQIKTETNNQNKSEPLNIYVYCDSTLKANKAVVDSNKANSNKEYQSEITVHQLANPLLVFFIILPLAAIAIEIMCFSERDAILRTGVYIRDEIEKRFRSGVPKGWEDWLTTLGSEKRRRTSEHYADFSRWVVVFMYFIASSVISFFILSATQSTIKPAFFISSIQFCIYTIIAVSGWAFFRKIRKDEFEKLKFYEIMALDVDGCLLNDDKLVSDNNLIAIEYLLNNGVKIVLASGRSEESLGNLCNKLNLKGKHVGCHGAILYDADNHVPNTIIYIESNCLSDITRKLNNKVPWVAFGKAQYYCLSGHDEEIKKMLINRKDMINGRLIPIPKIESYKWDEIKIYKILCFEKINNENMELWEEIQRIKQISVIRSTNETIEIVHKNASKVKAIKKIIREYHGQVSHKKYSPKFWIKKMFDKPRILAIGDYDNDLDMLKWAKKAVVPKNASYKVKSLNKALKAEASNNDDFIMYILKNIYNLEVPDVEDKEDTAAAPQ